MVRETRERMKENPQLMDLPTSFLEAILSAVEREESGFSDEEVFANAGTLLLAGEDTTANSIAWCIHYLTKYPEYFGRIRSEVDALVQPGSSVLDLDQTNSLPILDAFTNEVMRLRPVAPLMAVEANFDVDIMGYQIPKGTTVHILARKMATLNSNFVNASEFDPERWLEVESLTHSPHNRRAFIPFGAGPRLCPGRNLALLEIRMVLAMICRNFDLEAVQGDNTVTERMAFTMMPANLRVRLNRRKGF